MSKQQKQITITWRDENYGRIDDSFAFRTSVEPFPFETAQKALARIYKKAGFALHFNRQVWLAEWKMTSDPEIPLRLTSLLEDKGFIVKHAGAVPKILTAPKTEETVEENPAPKM